jgi:hypothetical protein
MNYSAQEREIFRRIGYFFLERDGTFIEAEKNIKMLEITRVTFSPNEKSVTICLGRPGLIIGKRGECIDKLTLYLKQSGINEVNIVEDNLFDFLIPHEY